MKATMGAFLRALRWIDGSAMLDHVEPYRLRILEQAFTAGPDGRLRYNLVVRGAAKKCWKTTDLVLAGLYDLTCRASVHGSGGYILANDLDQSDDDLDLIRRIVKANPRLAAELRIKARMVERRDGNGALENLPAKDIAGSHGGTNQFLGLDEIHGYKDYSQLEALAPDPTRDPLTWITSYDSLFHVEGRPIWDLLRRGKAGTDPRMLFDWHSGNYCTCADGCEGKTPEERANPSMGSWPEGAAYLAQQKLRLPTARYRRLHLNMGGSPEGAAFDQGKVLAATVEGRTVLPPVDEVVYHAFVDMSGGSNDSATLAIAHHDGKRAVLDVVMDQGTPVPFDPRRAVARFVPVLRQYRCGSVTGDEYAGQTFRLDFEALGIAYHVTGHVVPDVGSASDLYQAFEPYLNSGQVELLDVATLTEQLCGLVWKGNKVTHQSGEHDDWANGACGALLLAARSAERGVAVDIAAGVNPTATELGLGRDAFGYDVAMGGDDEEEPSSYRGIWRESKDRAEAAAGPGAMRPSINDGRRSASSWRRSGSR